MNRCDTYEKATAAEEAFEAVLAANPGTLRYVRSCDNEAVTIARATFHAAMMEWGEALRAAKG